MPYQAMNYQAAVRALVNAGDITLFSQLCDPRLVPIATMARIAGMNRQTFYNRLKGDLHFTVKEVQAIADHLGLSSSEIQELIDRDKKNRQ